MRESEGRRVKKQSLLTGLIIFVLLTIVLFSYYTRSPRRAPLHATLTPPKVSTLGLTMEASCVREVLTALHLPSSRSYYWMETFPTPLPHFNLSDKCRSFLTPSPVSPQRLKQLACLVPEPWFRHLGPDARERVRGAILIIREAFVRARIPLIIDGGTILGSWRMHGQSPFDPDVDFVVFEQYKQRAIETMAAIQRAHPNLIHNYMNGGSNFWRLNVIRPNKSRLFQIDLFFNTINNIDHTMKQVIGGPINMSRLLPLVQRPFEGALFHTYRDTHDYFKQLYGESALTQCKVAYWIPSFFKIKCATTSAKCKELRYFYNFVHRWVHPDGHLVEVLFNRTHALSVFYGPI